MQRLDLVDLAIAAILRRGWRVRQGKPSPWLPTSQPTLFQSFADKQDNTALGKPVWGRQAAAVWAAESRCPQPLGEGAERPADNILAESPPGQCRGLSAHACPLRENRHFQAWPRHPGSADAFGYTPFDVGFLRRCASQLI